MKCPNCDGDGYNVIGWIEVDPEGYAHEVKGQDPCELCETTGVVSKDVGKDFIEGEKKLREYMKKAAIEDDLPF